MALYFCHVSRNGVRFDDARGFQAANRDEAAQVVKAICAILFEHDPEAEAATVELYAEGGELIFASSLSALLSGLQ